MRESEGEDFKISNHSHTKTEKNNKSRILDI